jgi:acetyltransferase-like isoleucine patch superfamily enzyme/dTDP-4-dehydrorhamnose 3,5-epimerase-like enzyme
MNYYKHPNAIVESPNISNGTRIWAFAHILPGAVIGENCNICDHTFIENDVNIGNRVTIKCGVQIWDGVTLEDDVFIGPNATFTNDPYPRSKQYPERFSRTLVRRGASIGANATVSPGITIGINAMIGAGAVVMMDVPPNAIVFGNPARIEGYTSTLEPILRVNEEAAFDSGLIREINVNGVRFMKMPMVTDLRGILSYGEYDKQLPFVPRRYFVVADVPSKDVRGEHAHRKLHQLLICVKGSCCVALDDGYNRDKVILDTLDKALYIPPMVWASQYKYSQDAVLLVLASDEYDADSYIRDYDAFIGLVKKN